MDIVHHFIERGQGKPLILLHGNGEDCTYFANQMDAFAAYFHVYAVDTRGHGETPRGEEPFTIRQFADDLLGFMDAQGMTTAHILGFSDGGNIALTFALRYPKRLERLVLNGANLSPAGVKRTVQIPIEAGYRIARFRASMGANGKGKSAEFVLRAELLGLMVNDPNIPLEDLARVQAETLVIAGTNDMIKDGHTRSIAQGIPHATLAIIEGDHFIASKNPEAFNGAVLSFLLS